MKNIWQLLVSRKFAVWLLVLLAVTLVPGVVRYEEGADPAPLFILIPLYIFLFLSIMACSIRRLLSRREDMAVSMENGEFVHEAAAAPDEVRRRLAELFGGMGWQVDDTRADGVVGRQGEAGFWGSMLFHLGMLIILAGMVMSMVSRSHAGFTLTVGETKDLMAEGGMEASPSLMGPARVPLRVTLKDFAADYVDGRHAVDYRADLWLEGGGRKPGDLLVQVNRPFTAGDADVFLNRYGFALKFVLKKDDGTILSDYYYNLSVVGGGTDTFEIPEAGLKVAVMFFPDFRFEEGSKVKNVSQEPKNPGALVIVSKEGRALVDKAFVPMGKKVSFEGMSLQFADWTHWAHFGVSRDLGMPWLLAGFLVGVTGLCLRYVFPEKKVWGRIEPCGDGSRLTVGGDGGYFAALFREELGQINEQIKRALAQS